MLKSCWECVMGSRVDNDVYGTVLNGYAQTAWPEPQRQNEIMFRLPKALNVDDTIEINGKLQQTEGKLVMNFATGVNNPDDRNIACQLVADFNQNTILIRGLINGQIDNEEPLEKSEDLIEQFPDGKFKFIIKVGRNPDNIYLDIYQLQSHLVTRELKHNLQDITFLTLDGNIAKIEDLKFIFG